MKNHLYYNTFFNTLIFFWLINSSLVFSEEISEDFDDLHKLTKSRSIVDEIPPSELSDRAFEVLLEEMFPTSPKQITELKNMQKALDNALYDNKQPIALTDIIDVSTKPGSKPAVIRVVPLHLTTINIIDSTGQPWPITSVSSGNSNDYTISKVADHVFSNAVLIDAVREVGTTNLNISLVDMPIIITLTVMNNTTEYHPSPILQIDKEGPNAKTRPIYTTNNIPSDSVLKNIILGLPPKDFEKLISSDPNVEVWRHSGSLYVRSNYSPSSPLPRGIHHGPSGYSAYRLNDIPILVMTSSDGLEHKIFITKESTYDR